MPGLNPHLTYPSDWICLVEGVKRHAQQYFTHMVMAWIMMGSNWTEDTRNPQARTRLLHIVLLRWKINLQYNFWKFIIKFRPAWSSYRKYYTNVASLLL